MIRESLKKEKLHFKPFSQTMHTRNLSVLHVISLGQINETIVEKKLTKCVYREALFYSYTRSYGNLFSFKKTKAVSIIQYIAIEVRT